MTDAERLFDKSPQHDHRNHPHRGMTKEQARKDMDKFLDFRNGVRECFYKLPISPETIEALNIAEKLYTEARDTYTAKFPRNV